MTRATTRPDAVRLGVVGGLFVLYVLVGLDGYGNDNDTYHMLNTWNVLRRDGTYQPSRGTGYLVPEVAIGLLSNIGGHALSNGAVAVLAAAVLWLLFGAVQRHVDRPTAMLATLAVGLHPVWIIASSTSMDYLYALCSFAVGVWAMERRRPLLAAVLFGACVSARITFAVAVVLVHAAAAIAYAGDRSRWYRLGMSLGGAGLLAIVAFVPSFLWAGRTLRFLTFSEANGFSLPRAAANDVFHHLAFWGVPTLVLMALYILRYGRELWRALANRSVLEQGARFVLLSSLLVFVWFEAFFLRLPAEPAYLLPALPGMVLILALGRRFLPGDLARNALALLLAFELIQGIVRFDFFRLGFEDDQPATFFRKVPLVTAWENIPLRSHPGVGASVGLFVEEGVLLEDWSLRRSAQASWTKWLSDTWPNNPR